MEIRFSLILRKLIRQLTRVGGHAWYGPKNRKKEKKKKGMSE